MASAQESLRGISKRRRTVGSATYGAVLAKGHEIRNIAEYEGEFDVEERIVADMIAACLVVADRLETL